MKWFLVYIHSTGLGIILSLQPNTKAFNLQVSNSFLDNYPKKEGVYILSEVNNEFESSYLEVREKEKRIYSDDELMSLPFSTSNNPHVAEWKIRAKSFLRFRDYIQSKKGNLEILDLGCGNGWFSGQLSKSTAHNYYCVDVNLKELKQARRVFNSDKVIFIYADIFTAGLPHSFFNLITINAAIQYFPNLKNLVDKLLNILSDDGEVHIIDSPFYKDDKVESAQKRTEEYYNSLGFPEMAKNYFHHSFQELSAFNFEILYKPKSTFEKLGKLFSVKDSPFPWIRIRK